MNQVISSFLIIYTGNVFVCFSAIHTTCFIPHALTPPPLTTARPTRSTVTQLRLVRIDDHVDHMITRMSEAGWSYDKILERTGSHSSPLVCFVCLFVCVAWDWLFLLLSGTHTHDSSQLALGCPPLCSLQMQFWREEDVSCCEASDLLAIVRALWCQYDTEAPLGFLIAGLVVPRKTVGHVRFKPCISFTAWQRIRRRSAHQTL